MTTRADIAAALTATELVTGSEFRPSVLTVGNAWAQVTAWDRGPGQAYGINWAIYVVLPADERAAATWLDTNLETLVYALRSVVFVTRMEPISLAVDTGSVFAVLITAESE